MSSSRDTSRDVCRLASLYNAVAFEQLRAFCWDVLVDYDFRDDDVLEIAAQVCQKPVAQTPPFGQSIPENVRRTFVSINKCVAVIVWNCGWLASCIESLDIDIKEMSILKPKRVHKVELRYLPGNKIERTDYCHTVLLFTPRSGEEPIVADASYAQYSFDNGIDTFAEYLAAKVHRDSVVFADNFGEEFERYEKNYEIPVWDMSKRVAIIRSTNNVIVRELRAVGGIEALLDLSSDTFETARDAIFQVVRREMEALRLRLERIKFGPDPLYLKGLKDLREDCDGAGHQSCMRSVERERSVWPFGFAQPVLAYNDLAEAHTLRAEWDGPGHRAMMEVLSNYV